MAQHFNISGELTQELLAPGSGVRVNKIPLLSAKRTARLRVFSCGDQVRLYICEKAARDRAKFSSYGETQLQRSCRVVTFRVYDDMKL
jgi:hypothetical protein